MCGKGDFGIPAPVLSVTVMNKMMGLDRNKMSISDAEPRDLARRCWEEVRQIFDSDYFPEGAEHVRRQEDRFEIRRAIPFILLHLGCLGVIWTGWSPVAVAVALAFCGIRIFAVTAFYHRYFSHRTFRTSRAGQFFFAILGNTALQRGPLWWAAVHRHHHAHSDQEEDVHSPELLGFVWAHIGWMTSSRNFPADYALVRDLAKFPELRFLNRFDLVVPAIFGALLYALGEFLEWRAPQLQTSEWQRLLENPTEEERRVLSQFHYQPNQVTLHTSDAFMPATRRCWASWNYRLDGEPRRRPVPSTHYWMNSLQGVSQKQNYFVSLYCGERIASAKVLRKFDHEHPLFDLPAVKAQEGLPAWNCRSACQEIYFAGAWFKYGFHEDGLASGLECARALTGEELWS